MGRTWHMPRITDKLVREMPTPSKEKGQKIIRDDLVTGFGVRKTATGNTAFVLHYSFQGRERRMTIGGHPAWSVAAARDHARTLRRMADAGKDPLGLKEAARDELTLTDLWERYMAEVLLRKAPSTQRNERSVWVRLILPTLGRKRLSEIVPLDIDRLHNRISARTPVQANRCLASLGHVFSTAKRWNLIIQNPVGSGLKNRENGRERYLSKAERKRLLAALDNRPDTASTLAIRFLLLTGARRGEVLSATWDQFDLSEAVWIKPSAHTKQRKLHRVPISEGAVEVLRRARPLSNGEHVFPGRTGGALVELKKMFGTIRQEAGVEDFRIHDLRHSYASFLVSDGASLPIVGRLLGHTQAATTNRYSHLEDDALRQATNRLSRSISDQRKSDA